MSHEASVLEAGREALLAWYADHARDLPWRRTRDPYAIWVSEVMLQQTRVETVIPYFERFMTKFPTPHALASSDEDAVLSMWSGLGYYRRARLLHRGVKELVASYDGHVPTERTGRESLPGVGAYTAGAIGSIAFGLREPIVDGNVARVFARLYRIEGALDRSDAKVVLWSHAARWADHHDPASVNQGLMELGATVCIPKNPKCDQCPVRAWCVARTAGRQTEIPPPKERAAKRTVSLRVARLRSPRGAVLFVRGNFMNGNDALFGGLWGLPTGKSLIELKCELTKLGVEKGAKLSRIGNVQHVLSHRALEVDVHDLETAKAKVREVRDHVRWMHVADLENVGVSALTRRILAL